MCVFLQNEITGLFATHFDVTRDIQMCRDTLFEKHCARDTFENYTINFVGIQGNGYIFVHILNTF
jgi:hypothetical protein